jgi:hypothetical protein
VVETWWGSARFRGPIFFLFFEIYFSVIAIRLGLDVRGALGAGEHGVGFVVVVEALEDGVPVEVAGELHGDVVEEAGGAGAVADLDWGGGWFAGVDALDPVGVLLGGGVEVDLVGADDGVEDFGVAGHKRLDLRGWRAV